MLPAEHAEGAVEPGPLGIRQVRLGGGDADIEAGDAEEPLQEEHGRHEGDGHEELPHLQKADGNIDRHSDGELPLRGELHLIVDETAHKAPRH